SKVVKAACDKSNITAKLGGSYLCMEGPQFSTKAESNLYRSWGLDVIGMTNLQEAKLSREAEICYATVAMVTDYDCWHAGHDSVTVEQIIAVLVQNASNACEVVRSAVAAMPRERRIDTTGIEHAKGKTFHWSGEYGSNPNECKMHDLQLNVFEKFQPKIPPAYLDSEYVFLGNIHPALQAEVYEKMRKAARLVG